MYIYILHVFVDTCYRYMYIFIHIQMHVIYLYIYIYIYLDMYIFICTYIYIYIYVYHIIYHEWFLHLHAYIMFDYMYIYIYTHLINTKNEQLVQASRTSFLGINACHAVRQVTEAEFKNAFSIEALRQALLVLSLGAGRALFHRLVHQRSLEKLVVFFE